MGVEFQDHSADTTIRISGYKIEDNTFDILGVSSFGFGISLSGYMTSGSVVRNEFKNCEIGVEMIGCSETDVSYNKFRGGCAKAISASGSRVMTNNKITYNTDTTSTESQYFWMQDGLLSQGNSWNTQINMRDTINSKFISEKVHTTQSSALFIEGDSSNNEFIDCLLSNINASNNSTLRTNGAGCFNNHLTNCVVEKGSGGVYSDTINGGEVITSKLSTPPNSLFPEPQRQGNKLSHGLVKRDSGGLGYTELFVDIGATQTQWRPAIIKVRCCAMTNNNSDYGHFEATLWIKHRGYPDILIEAEINGTPLNLTLSTTFDANRTIAIRATSGTSTSTNHYQVWDCEVVAEQYDTLIY